MLHNLYLLIFLYRVLSEIPSSSAAFLRFPLFLSNAFSIILFAKVAEVQILVFFLDLLNLSILGFGFVSAPNASCSYFLTDVL